MPEMDGLEVQQALIERGMALPVIVLTGHGDISVAVRAMKAGAVDFLEKPFEKARLLDAIGMHFEAWRQRQAQLSRELRDRRLLLASAPLFRSRN